MARKLIADYSKRLDLPGYSSHQSERRRSLNRLLLLPAVALLFLGMPACREEESTVTQHQLAFEQNRRVQAEQLAVQTERRATTWQSLAITAGLGGVVLLIVGAALGSMSKRDAG